MVTKAPVKTKLRVSLYRLRDFVMKTATKKAKLL